MSEAAAAIDASRLADLSRRLGIPARQLLIAAARLADADPERAADPAFRARVLADAKRAGESAEAAARLLRAPVHDYALNELDRLFATIWPDTAPRGDA